MNNVINVFKFLKIFRRGVITKVLDCDLEVIEFEL